MSAPRGLSPGEAALWMQIAATVTPLKPIAARPAMTQPAPASPKPLPRAPVPRPAAPVVRSGPATAVPAPPPRALDRHGLDASWERKLAKAQVSPDLTIDLHGLGLDAAYVRLGAALTQAVALQARMVLVIAGKSRPHDDHGLGDHAGRGNRRGAIRAKLLDWLAASPHAGRIAAVRPAAQRHGGAGAVYVVLRKAR